MKTILALLFLLAPLSIRDVSLDRQISAIFKYGGHYYKYEGTELNMWNKMEEIMRSIKGKRPRCVEVSL